MLFRLVQPVKRSGSSKAQFQKRIPEDLRDRIAGRKLVVPIGGEFIALTVSPKAASIRFSLRTSDPSETKIRHAEALAYLEGVFGSL
ncbi:MAG: recombinase XerD, partial [Siculibacillus sp.]